MLLSLTYLCAVGFAFDLECSSLEADFVLERAGNVLACHTKDLKVTEKDETMNPSTIDDNEQVKGLVIKNQIVNFIPKFTDSLAKRLEALLVDSCHLKVVSKEDLQQFPQLKRLTLNNNDVERLGGELFDYNPQLELFWFDKDDHKLNFIGANLLDSLTKLKEVMFNGTGCINFYSNNLRTLQQLKKKLETSCKDEPTKLKMLEHHTT